MTIDEEREPWAELTEEELSHLPVFPLGRVVFFPHTLLPLHVFEPRYRAMFEHCLSEGPKAIAVALLKDGYESDYEGNPPIHDVAGVGRIIGSEANDDGSYDFVLSGITRVRLEEYETDEPFRMARATVLRDAPTRVPKADLLALMSCAQRVSDVVRREHPNFELGVGLQQQPSTIADTLADRFVAEPKERQAILEELELPKRVELVTGCIGELLAMIAERETLS